MTDLWARDAWELADDVRSGRLSAVELLDVSLDRVERFNDDLNAVCYTDVGAARARAQEIDAEVKGGGDPGPFAGIPMGVKELTQAQGFPDTHASVMYKDRVAAVDGTEVARLRAGGAVIVGLTTAPEMGIPSFTNSPLHGVTRNPWNPEATPGGSSGGSAAAVASGMFPACTGSDGGGSIRIPSSYSGLPGFKSTFGLSGTGPAPFDAGMTSVYGPIVRSVRDAARYIDITSGPTLYDPTSLPKPAPFEPLTTSLDAARERLRGKKAAWSPTLGYGVVDTGVEKLTSEAAQQLVAEAGLELVDLDVTFPKPGRAWGLLSAPSLAAWYYEDAQDHLDDLDMLFRLSIEGLPHLRAEHLGRAIRRRHELLLASAEVFSEIDVLLTPTTATTAYPAEGILEGPVNGETVDLMILSATFTAPFNITGQPGFSIPAGLVDGMPVGMQVVARRHEDDLCVAAAALMEAARPWPKLAPGYE
jgi:aspartyl-tRNA(Asn)/glutamyl-tRNA(Gln) amidotransferase subunit A